MLVRLPRRSLPAPRLRLPASTNLPGPRRAPPSEEERAHRDALERAKRGLRDATRAHRSRVRAAKHALRRAERAHARSVREAERKVAEAARSRERAIRGAEQRLATLPATRELARLGPFRLWEDRLEPPSGPAVPTSGLGATVVPGNVVARSGFVTAAGTILRANGRPRRRRAPNAHRLYLVVEGPAGTLVAEVQDEWAGRDFAAAVNVASLNATRLARERATAEAALRANVDALRREHDAAVLEASAELAAVEGDRAALEAAERGLEEAVADTGDVVRCRAQLEAIAGSTRAST